MDEKTYLIQILLEARERVSQVAQKVAQQLDKVTKAQDDVSDSAKRANAVAEQQRGALEQLYEARVREKKGLDESAAALRSQSAAARQNSDALRGQAAQVRASADALKAQRDAAVKAQQASLAEASSLRDLARARAEQVGAIDKTAQQLTRQAEASRREADQNRRLASSYDQTINGIERRARALERDAGASERDARSADRLATTHERSAGRISRSIGTIVRDLGNMEGRTRTTEAATSRLGRTFERLGIDTRALGSSLRGLNSEFQGFQLAVIIKYAQSLLSTLVALGAQLVAVAAAAGQAAAGIGAAFGAAAAQAIPVVGVLAAAFGRLTAVLKAVKLQNQQQLTDTHAAATAAQRQTSAADQIRNAQQQVADAHRNVARAVQDLARAQADASRQEVRAQRDVTQARKDAIRTVEDLIAAERDAQVQLLQAQASLRGSVQAGDVLGTLAAFDAQTTARQGVTRATQDAAPVRARGVEGVPAVQQSEQRLGDVRRSNAQQLASSEQQVADAQRQSRRSEQDLARTRVQAAQNIAQETAAADKLTNSIKLLSPAEQQLYRRILALQETYKRAVRPITDIITNAFTGVVDRVSTLLRNPQIMRGFRNIAVEIAGSIRQATSEAGGPRSVGIFELLQREAARNIPIVTRIAVNFFRTLRSLVVDALPSFRLLLSYVGGYASALRRAVDTHPGQLRDFFVQGVRYANQFFKLGLAVVRLLLAIGGRGGAAHEGARTINELTGYVDHLTDRVNHNAGSIRRFFASTHDSVKEVLGVLGALGSTLIRAFNPGSVKTLAEFLRKIIIPALGDTIQIMGVLVNAFHAFLTLPGVSTFARYAVTALLFAKGLTIIHEAVHSVLQILPVFMKTFGFLVPVIDEATGAVTGFELAAGGPIVLAIAAVIAAIILLNQHFHFLGPTFRWLKGAASDAFDWIKGAAKSVVSWFKDVWNQGLLKWIRYPFEKYGQYLPLVALVRFVIGHAQQIIDFFSNIATGGGGWASIRRLLLAPFNFFKGDIKLAFDIIRGIVKTFLDVLAGRFGKAGDDLKQMFNGVLDVLAGAASSFLGIWSTILTAMGKIPGIGGPFKAAAQAIDGVRGSLDDFRGSLHGHKEDQGKSDDAVRKSLPNLIKLHDRYQEAADRLSKLTPGTAAYRQAVKDTAAASLDYNVALKDTADKADGARPSVRTLKTNIGQLGDVSADTATAVAQNLNDVLKQMGAKTIKLNTRAYRHSGVDTLTNVTGHAATGGVLSRAMGLRRRLWGGGIANPYGGAADDHVLYSPTGAPVAALSGTEGIINRPQMGVIDQALGFANAMGAVPWGSLNDLWGSGMRHYAAGGKLQLPTNFTATHQTAGLSGYPAVDVFGTPGEAVGSPINGRVVKLSGRPPSAGAYQGAGGPFGWSEYISGAGRTYFLTHFGSRSVSLGQSVRRGQTIGTVGDYPGATPDHIHEGLHGGPMGLVPGGNAAAAMIARILAPQIRGDTNNAIGRIATASARLLARAANRYAGRQTATAPSGDFTGDPGTATGNGAGLMRQISRRRGWNFADWWRLDAQETGHGANTVNPSSTARLRGQFLSSNWGKYGPGSDPRGNPSMAQQIQSMAAYIAQRYRNPTQAWQHEQAFNWYGRGGPLKRLQTGGSIKGIARPRRVATSTPLAAGLNRALDPINALMDGISTALESVARGPLRRSRHLATRITKAFDRITGDAGLLSNLSDAVDAIAASATTALQRRQFRVGPGGPRRAYQAPAQLAQESLQALQATRTGLVAERTAIGSGLADAQDALVVAQRTHNKRAEKVAQSAIDGLRARQTKVSQDLAQNAQDQVEAQEAFQQALLDSVNAAADQQNNAIDRWSRVAKAIGRTIDPNVVIGAQVANMRRQIGGLQSVLTQAMRVGNLDLARTVRGQIDDLNTQIAEAIAQQFQNSIDAVNNQAQSALTANDRVARRAQIGATNYAALGGSLTARGSILADQRAGLAGLLAQAQASGNVDQVKNLTDQIDELDTAIAENTQAVQDNTDAAFNAITQDIKDRQSFSQGFFGNVGSFLQAFTARTGIDTTSQQATALRATGSGLATEHVGLIGRLGALLGYAPGEIANLVSLSGSDLVGFLSSIAAGPAFDAIMARLDPTQQASFRDLLDSLLANATATEQNTQALQDLVGNNAQSFTSSFWSAFRVAVFNGAGGLLPQYAMTIPGADVGARVINSGALMVHAGETVRPAVIDRDWRERGGDTYHLNMTSPTLVANPSDFGRQLSFLRRTSGR